MKTTSQVTLRIDEDTREMLDKMTDHYIAVFGSSDMSFAFRAAIRKHHKETFPEQWHGEYYRPELKQSA